MNKKRSIIAAALIFLIAIAAVLVHRVAFASQTTPYRFVAVERGNMQSTVSATGTLNAVTSVAVGTQVSGQIRELLVDYNDRVTKGQLLARIDDTLAQQAVTDAQANLEKAQALAVQASRDFARNAELTRSGLLAKSAYEQTQSALEVEQAGVKSARIALDRARQNLAYTNIYAPIDGVVVERNVQQGQTVAASLSAPQLFLIANDLSHMQILAQVGESDIAQIKEGQPVEFTVQALQGQTFKGSVKQVRLQSTTLDNVVNYTVVVTANNAQGKLLPGMTARANFLTKSAENVLKVANAALRYKPAQSVTPSVATTSPAPPRKSRGNSGTLYYLDKNGTLAVAGVRTGISDGSMTEVAGPNITEGMQVIGGTTSASQSAQSSTSATPFQSNTSTQQRRGPGGF